MEDDNLILLLNTNNSQSTTPIQQKREPLVEIVDNDDHDSVVTMTCLNDRILPVSENNPKRHFNDIKLVRPSSATSQGSRSKKQEKMITYFVDADDNNGERQNENFMGINFVTQAYTTPDVQISRFDKDSITSKTAFARSQLAKRFSINHPQQRPVPIQSLTNTTTTTTNDLTSTTDQQQTLAATVAASVAVSVAQPFLKLQNELEHKMNTLLDKIHQQPTDSNKLLNDCVDTRMNHIGKMQEQQQQVFKQLADLVQATKSKSKSKSPVREHETSDSPPQQQYHFLDTLVGKSSPSVRLTKLHKKSPTSKEQPPNSHFNIESSSPYACLVCDRSRSRSRSRSQSPTKGLSPDSSYPRPFVPVPRPPSIMSDGFIPSSTSAITSNALNEVYPPFDKYLNNSIPPSPLQPKSTQPINENLDLHERVKQIDEAKNLLDENYSTLQRRKNDVTLLEPTNNESIRIQRLVEQCVKQVTRQVREEVKLKLEEDEIQDEQKKTVVTTKKRPTSKTQLAFDRHSTTTRTGKQTIPTNESTTRKPYSDAFMEAVYGRSLYQKIKKDGKQPYFKLKNQSVQQAKQAKQIEQIPVRDIESKSSPRVVIPPRHVMQQPPPPVYEPEYSTRRDGVILLGPPQIRDTRTFQPTYVPSAGPKLTPHILPSVDVDPSTKKVRFGQKSESIKVDVDDSEEEDDDGQGIEIPGYHRTQDDTLQSGAIDWLEQELIARFMSQLQNQQTTVPIRQHRDVISARSSTSSSSDDRSIHDRLLDLLGQDGFQLFIDMGQPIDQDLIQALTREVLEERIAQMIGFRSPKESIHVVPPPRTTTSTTSTTIIVDHHHWPQEHNIPTPQPTPPPIHHPRVVTPEITGGEVSTESESSTPRSVTPHEDSIRPLPFVPDRSVDTSEPSDNPSPPSTLRLPRPPLAPSIFMDKRDASTMVFIEISAPPRQKQKTPSPTSSASSSSSSLISSSSLSSFSVPYSSSDSPLSDHMWFDDRSEGQIDLLDQDW